MSAAQNLGAEVLAPEDYMSINSDNSDNSEVDRRT